MKPDDPIVFVDDDDFHMQEAWSSLIAPMGFHVIFISGHHDDAIRRKAVEDGAFAFMYKPFDPGDLLGAVNRGASNVALYPKFQEYFRKSQPPLLAIWGRNDPFFLPAELKRFEETWRTQGSNSSIQVISHSRHTSWKLLPR